MWIMPVDLRLFKVSIYLFIYLSINIFYAKYDMSKIIIFLNQNF